VIQRLRRHPLPLRAHFRHSLVLAYAFPPEKLQPLIPGSLVLDRHGEYAFGAVALVQADALRPSFLPSVLGRRSFYAGYRIFVRVAGQTSLRGLYILRTDTNDRLIGWLGRLTTHYNTHAARVALSKTDSLLELEVQPADGRANLHVRARLQPTESPPSGSPFADLREARRFAGPLPYTFHAEADRLVSVRGVRTGWEPQPVAIESAAVELFDLIGGAVLANAFYVANVAYRWERGKLLRY
jgi:hypothetical protein